VLGLCGDAAVASHAGLQEGNLPSKYPASSPEDVAAKLEAYNIWHIMAYYAGL
jgi:hypothetical protein